MYNLLLILITAMAKLLVNEKYSFLASQNVEVWGRCCLVARPPAVGGRAFSHGGLEEARLVGLGLVQDDGRVVVVSFFAWHAVDARCRLPPLPRLCC